MDKGFDEHDIRKLQEAKTIIKNVYEFNYGFSPTKQLNNRLKTVLNKLDDVIKLSKEGKEWKRVLFVAAIN